jgi:hypothetical protein
MRPPRLTDQQLTQAGEIHFPFPLCQPRYSNHCIELQRLFKERCEALETERRAEVDRKIIAACNRLLATHKRQINDWSVADYIAAKSFIQSLKHEVKFDPRPVLLGLR